MAELGRILAGLACAAGLAAGPAFAHQTEPTAAAKASAANTVSGVTVTAPRKPDPLVDPASQFVRAHVPENRAGQLSRFRDNICVNVVGLPAAYNAFVAKQIVKLAAKVEAPVDHAAKCTPNVNVIFSPNPQAQLDDIAKRREILMGFGWVAQMKQLATFERPIQSWYVTRSVWDRWPERARTQSRLDLHGRRPRRAAGERRRHGDRARRQPAGRGHELGAGPQPDPGRRQQCLERQDRGRRGLFRPARPLAVAGARALQLDPDHPQPDGGGLRRGPA